jgi:hypothetical protein
VPQEKKIFKRLSRLVINEHKHGIQFSRTRWVVRNRAVFPSEFLPVLEMMQHPERKKEDHHET